jgi:hypothetical protein
MVLSSKAVPSLDHGLEDSEVSAKSEALRGNLFVFVLLSLPQRHCHRQYVYAVGFN